MEYLEKIEMDPLQFILCGYEEEMIYHEYNAATDLLSAGKPLTVETAKTLFNFVNNIENINHYSFSGMIPKNVLNYKTDEKYIVWETPAEIKHIIYKEDLPVSSGEYFVPRLIWKLNGNKLSIWAIKEDIKSEKDKLYNAPFFNIYNDGSICMGSAKFLEGSYDYAKIIKKAENGFWNSTFTHTNTDKLLTCNFTEWCNSPGSRLRCPNDLLVETKKTIQSIL